MVHQLKDGWGATACGLVGGMPKVASVASEVTCQNCMRVMASGPMERFERAWQAVSSPALRQLYWMRAGIGPNEARKLIKMSRKRWPIKVVSLMRRQMLSNPECARLLGEAVSPIARGGEHDRRGQVQEAWRVDQLGPRCRLCGC